MESFCNWSFWPRTFINGRKNTIFLHKKWYDSWASRRIDQIGVGANSVKIQFTISKSQLDFLLYNFSTDHCQGSLYLSIEYLITLFLSNKYKLVLFNHFISWFYKFSLKYDTVYCLCLLWIIYYRILSP